jgi:5,10-methylenetetrahydrofolate reductase
LGNGGGELEEWETGKLLEEGRIGAGGEVVWGLMKVENNSKKRKFGLTDGVHSQESMIKSSEGGSRDKQDRQGKLFCPLADTVGSIERNSPPANSFHEEWSGIVGG